MPSRPRHQTFLAVGFFPAVGLALTARFLLAQSAAPATIPDPGFQQFVQPFLKQNCARCHSAELGTAGVNVEQFNGVIEDRHIQLWESIRRRVENGTMPPKGLPQPAPAERTQVVAWISRELEAARTRPAPKNGLVRRLTISQYRNTLRELLLLEDDLTGGLPPDAVSKDGFLNNKDTLQLSPLLTESYFEIAETALNRVIIDPSVKPKIQNFRVDLGTGVNPDPLPEKLILGAGSALLDNEDVLVTQLVPVKPFPFEPFFMRTKYRFIEGYRGNDTVRGWRDFDSIYHAVFADMRGAAGYPKGKPYSTVPQGLLLRPAIPNEENFDADGTYGPKANFKVSVRELPEDGRFRVTVTAAKYNDGLLLDPDAKPQSGAGEQVWQHPRSVGTVNIPKSGIYQVDVFAPSHKVPAPDTTHLTDGLAGAWPADQKAPGRLEGNARLTDSPLGKAVTLKDGSDSYVVPRKAIPTDDAHNVGEGDFTVAAWIHPTTLKRAGIASLEGSRRTGGWLFEIADNRGTLRFVTSGPREGANAMVSSRGIAKANAWQHVAAVVRRGRNETLLYLNGELVARGNMGSAQFDNLGADLLFGSISGDDPLPGEFADARFYRRPLEEAEIVGLVQPGRPFIKEGDDNTRVKRIRKEKGEQDDVTLTLGARQFIGSLSLTQPAFLAVRLEAGPLPLTLKYTGVRDLDRIVFTPLSADQETAKKFLAFERRSPRLGVHLGFRRDCGSTFAPVGPPQTVAGEKPAKFVFEGALRNFPATEVEKDNVNYLAGFREIAVRSEYTDGRDMPRLAIKSVEFEGPYYESWPPPSYKNIFVDFEHKNDSSAYARRIISNFATRAYRRPISKAEENMLVGVYEKACASGRDFQDSIKDALLVVLTSPQFLFLVETSKSPAPEPLDSYELASKLSYFLWNGPPDGKTLQLAANGALRAQLNTEVARMIADPRFERFTQEFTSQWLSLDKFQVLEPDRKRYPQLTRDARAQLKREPVEYVQYLIRNNLPVRDLVQSDFLVANETVASYYGLGAKTDSGFRFVAIPHGRPELGGVLTEAAIMAGLSDGRESNPVKRGAWVARKIIAEPPADPPPNVPALKEDTKDLTLRQRLEAHRSAPACMQCHTKIDPWGVPFEEFDASGRLKSQPADAKSTLPDKTEVSGARDLKRYFAEDRIDQIAFSFLKHLTTYAAGRTLTYSELNYLKQDQLKLKPGGYRMQDMVRYVASSKMFLEK
jgi:mono/diheme cytochrome c family protein